MHSILQHVQGRSLSILVSRTNPRVKVLNYLHNCRVKWQALTTVVDISLLVIFKQSLLPCTNINLKELAKKNLTSVFSLRCLSKESTHYTTLKCYVVGWGGLLPWAVFYRLGTGFCSVSRGTRHCKGPQE